MTCLESWFRFKGGKKRNQSQEENKGEMEVVEAAREPGVALEDSSTEM